VIGDHRVVDEVIQWRQNVPSGVSSSTTGAGDVLPVWSNVNTSKVSSIVPRPPGKMANALEGRVHGHFRVKEVLHRHEHGFGVNVGLENCSKGSSMFHASVCSRRALG